MVLPKETINEIISYYYYYWLQLSAVLYFGADSMRTCRMWFWMRDCSLLLRFFIYPSRWCTYSAIWLLHGWCHVKLLPARHTFCVHNTTMHQFTVPLHAMPHTREHVCLGVTCDMHFWQNDQDLARATAVTRRWNGYRNESAQKVTPEKKILPPQSQSCRDSNRRWSFRPRVRRSTTELSPIPVLSVLVSLHSYMSVKNSTKNKCKPMHAEIIMNKI